MSEFAALDTKVTELSVKADENVASEAPIPASAEVNIIPNEVPLVEEKANADLAVVTSMLSQLGDSNIAPVVVAEENSTIKEELRLLPFESHTSDLMFTDPSFNM